MSSQHPEEWLPYILGDWVNEHQAGPWYMLSAVPCACCHRAVRPAQRMSNLGQVMLMPCAQAKNGTCFGVFVPYRPPQAVVFFDSTATSLQSIIKTLNENGFVVGKVTRSSFLPFKYQQRAWPRL